MRFLSVIATFALGFALIGSKSTPNVNKLTAPTYYIAVKARFDGDPNILHVKGASNLPPRSRMFVALYDFVGQGSTLLSEQTGVIVGNDGFFEVTLRAETGKNFRHNMVCDVSFMPDDPEQATAVRRIVGRRGEHLGFPENPQAFVHSGGYYLAESFHVP